MQTPKTPPYYFDTITFLKIHWFTSTKNHHGHGAETPRRQIA